MMDEKKDPKKISEFPSELGDGSRNTLGERIRLAWQQSNMTQGKLSKLLGISSVTLSNYMKGARTPDSTFVSKISEILNIRLEWLMAGNGPMHMHKHDGSALYNGTIAHGGNILREQGSCLRCMKLEKELELERTSIREKDNALIEALKKIEEKIEQNGELRLETLKLQHKLDASQQMCREYQAKNEELQQRLSLSTDASGESAPAKTA